MAGWCRRSRRGRISTISTNSSARALAEAGIAIGERRRRRGGVGPRADRRADRRLDGGEGLAWAAGKPFIAVNHLEAHALAGAARAGGRLSLPAAAGLRRAYANCWHAPGSAITAQLGTSRDDAAGEAFDKTAKLLGLGYPGGPAIERAAQGGDPRRFALPRPLKGRAGCDFSFSGLKTAVRQIVEDTGPLGPDAVADLAAAVEAAICDTLADRTANAVAWFRGIIRRAPSLVAAGGVAANRRLRERLAGLAEAPGSPSSRRRPSCAPTTAR